ncbi:MAG: 2-oxoacid:acceptor oxidoreductase family protein [Pseudomonadota bacterium]|nr:2-oxoacid:acceptor oxidoreductase family protein [Pseudomonadota bacterium]
MLEIRLHGRGGQGAVIASRILSYAFFLEGKFAQSFPTFGAERRGAPVAAFVRVADHFINLRSQVVSPDYVLVMAAKLVETVDVGAGIKKGGQILINSDHPASFYLDLAKKCRVTTMNANELALRHHLGSPIMPLVNAPILGAFARVSGLVSLDTLIEVLPRFVPLKPEENRQAMEEAYRLAAVDGGYAHANP